MEHIITTDRLRIRPIEERDAEAVHAYAGDRSITMMMFLPKETPEETRRFVDSSVQQWTLSEPIDREYVVEWNGDIIGGVNLERCESASDYEMGWIIRTDCRGRGFATEAAAALIACAFGSLRAERVIAHCDARNAPSERVMQKLGMRLVSRDGTRCYPKTGVTAVECMYAVTRAEYEARTGAASNA